MPILVPPQPVGRLSPKATIVRLCAKTVGEGHNDQSTTSPGLMPTPPGDSLPTVVTIQNLAPGQSGRAGRPQGHGQGPAKSLRVFQPELRPHPAPGPSGRIGDWVGSGRIRG